MKRIPFTPLLFIIISFLFCCSPAKEEDKGTEIKKDDTTVAIHAFLYGLWSMDSANSLVNEGFYFRNDGTVDLVSSEMTGEWELKGTDTLKIRVTHWYNNVYEYAFKIDSLNESRMVLTDSDGVHVYRKVPFGMNNEGNVAQGYTGYILPGQSKEYIFDLPPAKKIALKMACPDSSVTFRLYDDRNQEITSADVRNWAGIVIRSGKYRLVLSKPEKSKWKEEADYDVKVMVY